jgi:hypothetical protein
VDFGRREDYRDRDTPPVDHNVALRANSPLSIRFEPVFFASRGRQRSLSPNTLVPSRSGTPCRSDPAVSFGARAMTRPRATP